MGRLTGKVALITGAGNGQGSSEAYLFAKEGAKVIATDIQFDNVSDVVERINNEFPGSAIALKHDVSSEEDWKKVAEEGVNKFGLINVLINNAGILSMQSFTDVTYDIWKRALDINAWSQFAGIKTVVPYMKKAGSGSIVNIGSLASIIAAGGFNPYTASKGAIEALTRAAALELGPDNIRVNSVHPGGIDTQMTRDTFTTEEARQAVTNMVPLKRLGQPEDVANLVLFLASDDSSYITGTEQIIDGGVWIQ
ncbi:SDR family NAD(P)-dependent oxidoreductase [Sporosarcina sp. FSL K6-3457]|uniref:SDR family NAD(P)-dependent oxidoreductase n=1 Tax=Sporosarcina sp. FSL K6-3457 TaxID=2978204 RepID=UPI0030FA6F08